MVECLLSYVDCQRESFRFADIGAGTGNLTRMLLRRGLSGFAIEPNAAMRSEGERQLRHDARIQWKPGTADDPMLPDHSVDWVVNSGSFDWATPSIALPRYHRMLRPGGRLTVIWDLRDLRHDPIERAIEDLIYGMVPNLTRAYVRVEQLMSELDRIIVSTGHFTDVVYMEAAHRERMDLTRYMRVWRAVHDIPSQVSAQRWHQVLKAIESAASSYGVRDVVYRSRSWTAVRSDS
ncbi:class I SAM-dependent methyltransferase [Ensifer aridi]|uniref:class I SAM-dependent methyltransferase n=1 Tax=Ensifer aridi TaxID=1708715 RepID=UPI003B82E5CC